MENQKWIVTVNKPGYLPECEPVTCDSYEEAYIHLLDELAETLDRAFIECDTVSSYCDNMTWNEPYSVTIDGYAHSIDRV